jgi:hypothetical protein
MPLKIRELVADLERAGFIDRGSKGSHRNAHPSVSLPVAISGQRGDDAKPRDREGREMKDSARYVKIVAWSEEDGCYVGSAPGLILGGCHGDDERQVFDELCQIVDEVIDLNR